MEEDDCDQNVGINFTNESIKEEDVSNIPIPNIEL